MLGRLALAGLVSASLLVSPAFAGSPFSFWGFKKACPQGNQSQCAIQITDGDGNLAVTEQTTDRRGSSQFALTYQKGDDNQAYTGQVGKDQFSLTTQVGDNNGGFVYQEGKNNFTTTTQVGDGTWAASSSIGDNTHAIVTITN